eukprot:14660332-Ditylum_brightwellii.AAC.1
MSHGPGDVAWAISDREVAGHVDGPAIGMGKYDEEVVGHVDGPAFGLSHGLGNVAWEISEGEVAMQ